MSLVRTRRFAAPMAVVTLMCFLATFVPPQTAHADTAAALGLLSAGAGGPSSLGVAPPSGNSPQAAASVDLPTGAVTSGFPFQLQTARGEAQPSLGLSYNSSNGVGFAGVGWTLNVPSIVRQGVLGLPSFTDPFPEGAAANEEDEYFVNGQRLIYICSVESGSCSGAPAGEVFPSSLNNWNYYRTEVDDGARYFFNGQTWQMQSKSGHLLQFGKPLDTIFPAGTETLNGDAVVPGGQSTTGIYRWNLVRDTDASGNTAYYVYDDLASLLGSGVAHPHLAYLTDIYDTPLVTVATPTAATFEHRVHLTWALPVAAASMTPLLDPVWRAAPYASLQRVDVTSFGSTSTFQRELVRSYVMKYIWNDAQTQYYLSSIESHGTCGKASGIDNPIIEPAAFTAACPMLTSSTYAYDQITGATQPVLPTIKAASSASMPTPKGIFGTRPNYEYIDINGDGSTDFIEGPTFSNGNLTSPDIFDVTLTNGSFASNTMRLSPQNPTGLKATVSDLAPDASQVIYGDWLGNGRLSWLWMNINATTLKATPEVYTPSTNANFLNGTTAKAFTALKGFDRGRAVDIDGDGLPDMTFVPASDGSANFTTTLSLRDKTGTISPFGAGTLTTCVTPDMDPTTYGSDSFRTMADVDGDGLPDLLVLSRNASTGGITFHIFTNRGNGTFGGVGTNQCNAGTPFASGAQEATSTQAPAGAALHFDLFNQSIVQFGDLNGDHLADFTLLSKYGLFVCLRSGYSISQLNWGCMTQSPQALGAAAGATLDMSTSGVALADLYGTGIEQVVYYTATKTPQALWFTNQGTEPVGLLTGITTKEGAHTTINYVTAASGGSVPVQSWVVNSIGTSNGLAGSQAKLSSATYSFSGPIYDGRDRVFAGFQTASVTENGDPNSAPSLKRTTTFATQLCSGSPACSGSSSDYGFFRAVRGLPVAVQEIDPASGAILSTVWNEYAWNNRASGSPAYVGLDGRQIVQLPLFQQHIFVGGNPGQSATPTVVAYINNHGADGTGQATVSIPSGSPEIRRQFNYDVFDNETSIVDFGVVGKDSPILQQVVWNLPSGDTTGWSYRPASRTTGYATSNLSGVSGPFREYLYGYTSAGQLNLIGAILSGTLPLPGPSGQSREAPAPPDASSDGITLLKTIAYDAYGNPTQVSGADTRCTVTTYDGSFAQLPIKTDVHLGGCASANMLTTTSTFDAALERVISQIDTAGHMTGYKYDNFGRVIEVDQPSASAAGMTATTAAALISYVDNVPLRKITMQTIQGPESGPSYVNHYRYIDSFGDTLASIDWAGAPTGLVAQFIVSGVHTQYSGGRTAKVYKPFYLTGVDPANFPADTYAYSSLTASFTYDALGRPLKTTDFAGNVAANAYHAVALSVDTQDQEQTTTGGRHAGSKTTVTRNGHGQVTKSVQHLVNGPIEDRTTAFAYQATGEPTQIVYPGGSSRWMTYDSLGRMVFNAEPNTSVNFSSTVGAAGVLGWTYAYNLHSELVGTSDARGCGENIYHDDAGRIVAEDYSPCNSSTQQAYSAPNLTTGDGTEAFYIYDKAAVGSATMPGFLMEEKDRAQDSRYAYDGRGRLKTLQRQITTPTASTAIASRYAPNVFTKTFGYTEANQENVTSTGADDPVLMPGGVSQVSASYTLEGALYSITSSYGTLLTSQTLDATGAVTQQVFGDKAATTMSMLYDNNGNPSTYGISRPPGPWVTNNPKYSAPAASDPNTLQTILTNLSITRDKVGNPIAISEGNLGSQGADEYPGGARPASRTFSYGDDYRLTEAQSVYNGDTYPTDQDVALYTPAERTDAIYPSPVPRGSTGTVTPPPNRVTDQKFTYDSRGNTTSTTDDANDFYDRSLGTIINGTKTTTIGATSYTSAATGPDQFGIASVDGTASVGAWHDGAGNVVQVLTGNKTTSPTGDSLYNYNWDEVGHLIFAQRIDNETAYGAYEFFGYDAGGRRVVAAKYNFQTNVYEYTVNVFDSLVLEQASFSGSDGIHGDYQHTAATEHLYLGAGGAMSAHAFYKQDITPLASSGKVHVFMSLGDATGSTSFIIDHDTSELVERLTYQPYGAAESDFRTLRWNSFREDIRYTGHWDDAEIGLIYFGARYYNPQLTRWMSPDPLTIHGLGGDPNPYAFVRGSPIRNIDLYGLNIFDEIGNAISGLFGSGAGATSVTPGVTVDPGSGAVTVNPEAEVAGAAQGIDTGNNLSRPAGVGADPGTSLGGNVTYDGIVDGMIQITIHGEPAGAQGIADASVYNPAGGPGSQNIYTRVNGMLDRLKKFIDENEPPGLRPQPSNGVSYGIIFPMGGFGPIAAEGLGAAEGTIAPTAGDIPATLIGQESGPSITVPRGATGPTPALNGAGVRYTGGAGGPGLNPRVGGLRIMDPTARQPGGYASYSNARGQPVNPLTGKTIAPSSPWWHILLSWLGP